MADTMVILFDPSVSGFNRGDEIIVAAVKEEIIRACADANIWSVSLHQRMSRLHRNRVRESDVAVVAGSNMLDMKIRPFLRESRWAGRLADAYSLAGKVILGGVGWSDRAQRSNVFGRWFYRKALHSEQFHAVRDSYTESVMKSLGWRNVLNTSCPTLWNISDEHLARIPKDRGKDVVTTITDYRKDVSNDRLMLEGLKKTYRKVYFWPQGSLDAKYFSELAVSGVEPIGSRLEDYNSLLESESSLDYVGTRLHGGIRALQKGRRTIIVGIDSRSFAIGEDTGLVVVNRNAADSLPDICTTEIPMKVKLPVEQINRWREGLRKVLV